VGDLVRVILKTARNVSRKWDGRVIFFAAKLQYNLAICRGSNCDHSRPNVPVSDRFPQDNWSDRRS